MGYETTLLIVERHPKQPSHSCLIDGRAFLCFKERGKRSYIYFPDSNTKTLVPKGTLIKEGPWCQIISILELCKCGHLNLKGLCSFKESDGDYAFLPFNGDELIGEDPYGEYRKFVPINDVIKTIDTEITQALDKSEEPYRRFVIALNLLKSIREHFHDYELSQVGCLFYGH